MQKRILALFTVFMLLVSILCFPFTLNVQAYQNSSYFNNVKVGLESMAAPSLTITLNGDYTSNSLIYPSGTILNLKITNGNLNINGTENNNLTLTPNSSNNLLSLTNGTKTNTYQGTFTFKIATSKIIPINSLFMEDYLKGVVGLEMSDYFPIEALKAQAVAARNYAISRIGAAAAKGYDFDDTIAYQVYGGYNASYKNVLKAVDDTRGQILLYNDRLVETLYSASHGGYLEAAENVWGSNIPYLVSKPDSFENENWPYGNKAFTNSQIESTLKSKNYLASTDTFIKLDLSSITRYVSGRVSNINIIYKDSIGATKTLSLQKDKTRTFLNLQSNLYNVVFDSATQTYTFSGKGYGHGVGMSQIGAKNRATSGQAYNTILKFYYEGSYLQNLIPKASILTFTKDKQSLFIGNTINFSASAQAGTGQGYLYKYVITKDSTVVLTRDYNTDSNLSYVTNDDGNYTVSLYIKDKFSINDYDAKQETNFTVYNPVQISNYNLDKSEVLINQNITFNSLGANGSSSYLYKYVISKDNTVLFTRDYSSNANFVYTPTASGSYVSTLYLKDSSSPNEFDTTQSLSFKVYDYPEIINFVSDKTQVLNGQTINTNLNISGGSSKYLYKFVTLKNGTVVNTIDFNDNKAYSYTPASEGSYEVNVYIKDKLSDKIYDASSKTNFSAYSLPTISSVTSTGSMYENKSLTFNSIISGGSITGTSYKYEILKNGITIFSNETTTTSAISYTPTTAGTYAVNVYVKDKLSNSVYDNKKQFNITISSVPMTVTSLPLYWGMKGSNVITIQNGLNQLGFSVGIADGIFGSKTNTAVINFQKSKGITATGTVDSVTFKAMNDALIDKSGVKTLSY